jgi:FtsP/CotA-like multicopper oxidase with cupredoxin domain
MDQRSIPEVSSERRKLTMTTTDLFPREAAGLPLVKRPVLQRLHDGDRLALEIAPVAAVIRGSAVRMIGYNGSIPGPTLHVDQGSEIVVDVTNRGDVETTVHWHGVRLDNRYDGVPIDTQAPIAVGGEFTYRVKFPDAGFYWYHPHLREDYGQEMGMYGTIIVEPSDPTYWPAVDRQLAITLDDLLVEDGAIAPFSRSGPTFTAMGRFGNVLLVNGEERFASSVALGEVVRLHLVNAANTRIFNIAIPAAQMKLVGGDSGRYQRETIVEEVLLGPSERAIVDVQFVHAGLVRLEHRTPDKTYDLGAFSVTPANGRFAELRVDRELTDLASGLGDERDRTPDKVLAFRSSMPLLYGTDSQPGSSYACPMHPEITSDEAGRCPKCGMKLTPVSSLAPASYSCPMHPEITSTEAGRCPKCGMKLTPDDRSAPMAAPSDGGDGLGAHHGSISQSPADTDAATFACPMHPEVTGSGPTECPKCGMWLEPIPAADPGPASALDASHEHLDGDGLEWEDLMPDINRQSNPSNMVWCLTDLENGAENGDIFWTFSVGDRVKIRLVNELGSDHPMHHPFHIHGAGRFLILSRDGVADDNLVWKDTVLIPAGQTVDILLALTNPGRWMAHCHIAEHIESGMMFSFDVLPVAVGADR